METAHLRLSPEPGKSSDDMMILVNHRVSEALLGILRISRRDRQRMRLMIDWRDADRAKGFLAESLRRCLRMLFDDFGIGLVEVEKFAENQDLTQSLAALSFVADAAGVWRLGRDEWAARRLGRPILLVVAAALIDADNRVLLARRPEGKMMAGQWEFPGGKIADGETPEQALLRELQEEVGLELSESCLAPIAFASHDYDHFHLVMPLYAIRQWRGQPVPQEGQTLAWVAKDRLAAYKMPPADRPLVAQLRDWL